MNNEITKFLPFLTIFAPIILFWNQLRGFILQFIKLFWHQKTIPSLDMSMLILNKLDEKYVGTDLGRFSYRKISLYNKATSIREWMFLKSPNIYVLFKWFFLPIIVRSADGNFKGITISCFRGTINIDKLIESLQSEFNNFSGVSFFVKKKTGSLQDQSKIPTSNNSDPDVRPGIFHYAGINPNTILEVPEKDFQLNITKLASGEKENYSLLPIASSNKYAFTKEGRIILNEVKKWLNAKDFYQTKNIRWYRGCCLYSKPGYGKSSLILEIAKELNIPLYIFDLASMSNVDFIDNIRNLPEYPGIIVFEDLDCVFHGRENVTKTSERGGLTHDCFINLLSGSAAIENKFVFITTNNLDLLDSAVLRPGRMDSLIELPLIQEEDKLFIASKILSHDYEQVVKDGINDTPAEFENRCVSVALERYWK